MRYDYDLIVIGLGPAGMAVSIMASEMGLKVCAIEKNKIGGECMNVGCIPSKALLRVAKNRALFKRLADFELSSDSQPRVNKPFSMIQRDLQYINEKKTISMFDKVDLVLQQGPATFLDPHTISVGERRLTGRRIFICTGTRPKVPDFPGVRTVNPLTNENIFNLEKIPASLLIVGAGAIACEMAQAFARLGSEVTIVYRGQRLLRTEDAAASELVERAFRQDRIKIVYGCSPKSFSLQDGGVLMSGDGGQNFSAERVLIALGREMQFGSLGLEKAGVEYQEGGIKVDRFLRTSQSHIYAVGDCNGYHQFSHAAMHQGMIALMNSMIPHPFKRDFRKYVVPATIFTDPQLSHVGRRAVDLEKEGIAFEAVSAKYDDYGAAIAEKINIGFVKALISPTGKIYGATIVGEGSADMINEWGLAIQNKLRIDKILFLQHSFPSMAFLNKRVAEGWMMNRMRASALMRRVCQAMFRC